MFVIAFETLNKTAAEYVSPSILFARLVLLDVSRYVCKFGLVGCFQPKKRIPCQVEHSPDGGTIVIDLRSRKHQTTRNNA